MPQDDPKAERFARLHREPGILVLPNAWDAGSAILIAEAGFSALATTSAGIAFAKGLPDGQRLRRDEMIAAVAEIAAAVEVPVSADLEAGYGRGPGEVAETVRRAVEAGLAGCNIEDGSGEPGAPLVDIELSCDRIRAGAEAARRGSAHFVLNARVDPYLVHFGTEAETFAESVRRANAYREAGADCLFVPGPLDSRTIGRLVTEIDGPLNVLGARGTMRSPLAVADLERLGVKRVSLGSSLAQAALGVVHRALRDLKERGTFEFSETALPYAEINSTMARSAPALGRRAP